MLKSAQSISDCVSEKRPTVLGSTLAASEMHNIRLGGLLNRMEAMASRVLGECPAAQTASSTLCTAALAGEIATQDLHRERLISELSDAMDRLEGIA